jgi:hypothetical protein
MDKLLKDADLIKLLNKVDADLAEQIRSEVCLNCDAKLHRDDYPRKPRWVESWDKRYSYTCSRCRKRHTPPSVRFLGRKVYAGIVVVLVSAMMHGPNAQRIGALRKALGIDLRTLKRWRRWWLEVFIKTPFWKGERGRFMPVLDELLMPYGLVDSFHAEGREGLVKLLVFLAPITTNWEKKRCAM